MTLHLNCTLGSICTHSCIDYLVVLPPQKIADSYHLLPRDVPIVTIPGYTYAMYGTGNLDMSFAHDKHYIHNAI